MSQTQNKNSYSEYLIDIKVSLFLFKKNWTEFLLTEMIGLFLIFIFLFVTDIILYCFFKTIGLS